MRTIPQQGFYLWLHLRMDAAPLYSLYDAFAGDRHTFLYCGQFLDAHTARLITLGEAVVGDKETERSFRARLAFVLVEAYQNVIRHRPPTSSGRVSDGMGCLLLLRSAPGLNEVTTMNPVLRSDVQALVNDLEGLGALDRDQLKSRYLATLQREGRTRRGGAGLGLIEMARRSGNVLRHGFAEIDAEHLRFTLSLDIDPASLGSSTADELRRWYSEAQQAGLTLLCKGLDNQAVEASLLRIIEQETADDPDLAGRSVPLAHAGLEFLRSCNKEAGQSALALLQAEGRTAIALIAEVPLDDAVKITTVLRGTEPRPRNVTPLQLAAIELAGRAGALLQTQVEPATNGMARLLITLPVAVP
ncbi:MAG: SiaB family protein kinase [Flavobacteriales bacterium]